MIMTTMKMRRKPKHSEHEDGDAEYCGRLSPRSVRIMVIVMVAAVMVMILTLLQRDRTMAREKTRVMRMKDDPGTEPISGKP